LVLRVDNLDWLVNTDENVGNSHLVHGQGAGFVGTNIVCTAHDFARGKFLHEVLINKHSANGVGKSDHDCKWETFRHCDDNDSDSNQKISEPFDKVSFEVVLL
jgi:hypothetical protein